jgi:hypothetical protein
MADVIIEVTLKDAHVNKILEAINAYAGVKIGIKPKEGAVWSFSYGTKQDGETNKQYGERFVRELIKAFVRTHDYNTDLGRYSSDIDSISLPSHSIPNEIVE